MIAFNVQEAPLGRSTSVIFLPGNDLERGEVRQQLGRVLTSPAFHNSKRYAAVLKFIVDQTLGGLGDRLKERTIGIEVFDRQPDYDTSTDHAVRSAVAEVRKRLAQYYLESPRGELRIEIPSGSYMPHFLRWPEQISRPTAALAHGSTTQVVRPIAQISTDSAGAQSWPRPILLGIGCGVLALLVLSVVLVSRSPDPLEGFWRPILSSRTPILLCIGNVEGGQDPPAENPGLNSKLSLSDFHNSPTTTVNEYDAFTLAKFAGLLQAHGREVKFASQSDATFTDLQSGPAILVGLLNNNWTERLVPKVRFTVDQPSQGKFVIRDRNNPSNHDWSVDYSTPYLNVTKDYALVLRMVDPKTEQTEIVAAGITVFGTSAAGDFLTNKNELKKLAAIAPPGWEKQNMEIVLSTDVIKGRYGPASIIATQFW